MLKLLVKTQAQHLLTSIGGVAGAEIGMNQVEQWLELQSRLSGQHSDQFLRENIRAFAREIAFK